MRSLSAFAFACAISLAALAQAQLPHAALNNLYPPGGKAGTAVDVTVQGVDLDDADKLVFNHPGITAAPKMQPPANEFQPAPQPIPGQFTVTIGAVPAGRYEATVIGRFGASNPRPFIVGTVDEILETPGNNSPDKAIEIKPGQIINGRAEANAYDYYKLTLKAGERVLIDCQAQSLDSKLNPILALVTPSGKELLRVRDAVQKNPIVDFTAPAEGVYLLKMVDTVYAGGPDYAYRLGVNVSPQIDFIFPPAGVPGTSGPFTIYGRNLPGGQPADGLMLFGAPLQKLVVNVPLPADDVARQQLAIAGRTALSRVWLDSVEHRVTGPNGMSDPAPIYLAKAPVALEQEPNDAPAQATKVNAPADIAGQFYPQADADWYQFDAKKGDVWQIEVISHQLGQESDPSLAVFRVTKNDKGEEQVADVAQMDDPAERAKIGGDYDTSTDDPAYRLAVPDDGTYRVLVRDQFGEARKDPRFVYRLIIRKEEPDFRVVAYSTEAKTQQQLQQAGLSGAFVPKGGSLLLNVELDRRDGFTGEVQVALEGLPAGVTCSGAVLGGAVNNASMVVMAAENAAPWTGPIKVVAKANINGKDVVREARYATMVWGTANRQQQAAQFRLTPTLSLTVAEKQQQPVQVSLKEDKVWETSLGGNVEVPLAIKRQAEFKEAVKLTATGLPNEIKPKEINLDANAAESKLEIALNQPNIKPGSYTFYLRGETKQKLVRNPDAVPAAEAEQKRIVEAIAKLTEQMKQQTAAKDQATKAAQEAAAAAKKAETDKAEAAVIADLQAKAKAAEEARVKAEAELKATNDKIAQGNQMKTAADNKLNQAKQANQPKDVTFAIATAPVKLRIVASPLQLAPAAPTVAVKQKAKAELPVNLTRLYGFADNVEIEFAAPGSAPGLAAPKVTLNKDQPAGKLEVSAAANTPPGDHTVTLKAKGKFNNVNVEATSTVVVKVEAAP